MSPNTRMGKLPLEKIQNIENKILVAKWDYIIIKGFCIVNDTIIRGKKKETKQDKMFVQYICDRRSICNIYETRKVSKYKRMAQS